ncbi:MAG: nucleotidyltransferase family protein [Alphaproteobacteria bacterium]|nr:nucleotidyltransferase family protein [Alphaproteobacteria bacterium]
MARLRAVRALGLPDWAIGAGFVRGLVWDRLTGRAGRTALPDIDVLYFDPADLRAEAEARHEAVLAAADPGPPWSVKNQARMHLRNGDPPYRSTAHALTSWLETPTCVAVRLEPDDALTVLAPYGLDDLFALRVAPTPAGQRKLGQYRERLARKEWARTWPLAEIRDA